MKREAIDFSRIVGDFFVLNLIYVFYARPNRISDCEFVD